VDFEQYLMDCFMKVVGCLDDDLPDAFDEWLEGLDVDDWLNYGDNYKRRG
jgi:hypothetical protein